MQQTTELAALLAAGQTAEALAVCAARAGQGVGGSYYAFWLDRLRRRAREESQRGAAGSNMSLAASDLHAELVSAFTQAPYGVADALPPDMAALQKAKHRLLAASPFKSEIYLPTAKVPLVDQVFGLQRVQQLLAAQNLSATARRFEMLRQAVRARGARRVFVIGNGPSLKQTDLSLLKDEITIGFNGIFLHESFTPTIYVVEDHLVAEDRVREIHAYRCPVKLFPSYLAYCIRPQENTIFLNHRPRISYPVDTDFSADAGHVTYTGGTVTYTGLQIAASLGVEEVVLIGVDASYKVHNVERSDSYGTGVLTSREDDTNHFDPRYFGKGYRWHDPNVHTMLQAYRKAREHARDHGLRVVNATLGGELEVFERADYHALFPREQVWPRLAVLDFTSVNRLSATGVVKRNLLQGWPKSVQLHVHADEKARLVAFQNVPLDLYAEHADDNSVWPALRALAEYDPQVLYLRPTLDRVPMTVLQVVAAAVLGRPWVVHYMDDWLDKAGIVRTPEVAAAYREVMAWVFCGAAEVLSICARMSSFLCREFALPARHVHAVHNLLPAMPPQHPRPAPNARVVRYFGGLEPDMGLGTLQAVARQVEAWNAAWPAQPLRLEIVTAGHAIRKHGALFEGCPSTTLCPQLEDYADYLQALCGSDLNLVCYNFNEASLRYVRYSLANKLPELLASGVPFLAIGHPRICTMELLHDAGYPLLLTSESFSIEAMLQRAFAPDESQLQAWHDAVKQLKEEFSDENNRQRLHRLLRSAAAGPAVAAPPARPPLRALRTLVDSVRQNLRHSQDLDVLLRLPELDPALLAQALQRVRAHGRGWSVRDEHAALLKVLKTQPDLAAADAALQVRALAVLIAGLGHERHKTVNDAVRRWVLGANKTAGATA